MITRHTPLRPQDLPGWVIVPGDAPLLWHHGAVQRLPDDLGQALDALGQASAVTERLAAALAPWYGVPAAGERVLIACAPGPWAPRWRAGLAALAAQQGYAPTTRVVRLSDAVAVWTFGSAEDASALEPLWCTAAVAGLPLVWVSPTGLGTELAG